MNSPVEKCARMLKFLTEVRDKRIEQMKKERDLEYNSHKSSTPVPEKNLELVEMMSQNRREQYSK